MYEELVTEFESKKVIQMQSEQKDHKLAMVSLEVNNLKTEIKAKDDHISAFKRELSSIVAANAGLKEFEESTKLLYQRFVLGDTIHGAKASTATKLRIISETERQSLDENDDEEDAHGEVKHATRTKSLALRAELEAELVENAKEADRRRVFVESSSQNLKGRLESSRHQGSRINRVRLAENSSLMYECNDLRWQVKELERKLIIKEVEMASLKTLAPVAVTNRLAPIGNAQSSSISDSQSPLETGEKALEMVGSTSQRRINVTESITDVLIESQPKAKRRSAGKRATLESPSMKSVKVLSKELDTMVIQLERSHREREAYRLEAARLKKRLEKTLGVSAAELDQFPFSDSQYLGLSPKATSPVKISASYASKSVHFYI